MNCIIRTSLKTNYVIDFKNTNACKARGLKRFFAISEIKLVIVFLV